jgi:hypothetical protein
LDRSALRLLRTWQALDAKNPANNFGRDGEYKGMWVWYESWLQRVRAHCQEHAADYRHTVGEQVLEKQ